MAIKKMDCNSKEWRQIRDKIVGTFIDEITSCAWCGHPTTRLNTNDAVVYFCCINHLDLYYDEMRNKREIEK